MKLKTGITLIIAYLFLLIACCGLAWLLQPVFWPGDKWISAFLFYIWFVHLVLLGGFLQRGYVFRITTACLLFGSFGTMVTAAGAVVYFVLHAFVHVSTAAMVTRIVALVLLVIISLWCWFEAYRPRVVNYQIHSDKPLSRSYRLCLVSDTHFGMLVGHGHIKYLRKCLAAQPADILIHAGDLVDDRPYVFIRRNMSEALAKIELPLGKFAVLGNHDNYKSRQEDICEATEKSGFTVLRDEAVDIDDCLRVIGRRDKVETRKAPDEMVSADERFQIVIDHQPDDADKLAAVGGDLILSGHTHNGQIFPATLIIKLYQKYTYGKYPIGNAHLIISCGLGMWGLPMRMGARSEVVMIDIVPGGGPPHSLVATDKAESASA